MRIERHGVSEAAVVEARTDFPSRIGSRVRTMSKAGRMTNHDWWEISEEFLTYLGALSVENPGLETLEAKYVLGSAAEAATGAMMYAAYYPYESFSVFLDYVNFGMGYEAEAGGVRARLSADEWLGAFCLAVLAGTAERHREALHFARQSTQSGQEVGPIAELIDGLMAYALGDLGDDDADYPLSAEQKLAAIEAALGRVRAWCDEVGQDPSNHVGFTALLALRALAADDQARFDDALTKSLLGHKERSSHQVGLPGSLLPLVPLALAALAYRREGWRPVVDTDYLPHGLVTGFEDPKPKAGPSRAASRTEMIADLSSGARLRERPE